jgi:hypothetical protein
MRKTALTLTVSTLVLGVFGAFLRWLQTMNAFDKETGFPIPGAGTTVVFVIYSVLVIAAICVVTLVWLSRFDRGTDAGRALRCDSVFPLAAAWVLCAAFAAASCILLFSAGTSRYPLGQRLFGGFGILAALSLPFLFGKKGGSGAGPLGRSAVTVVTLFYCFWMVFCYRMNSENPVLWQIAPEILAITAATAAFYFIATFFYSAGHAPRALIAVALGVYLNIATLFDERSTALNVMLGVTAAALLLLEYLLISNMKEKHDEE